MLTTPTYNRAHTLPRLYNSLLEQTDYNFEWLIVDDGSTDNTSQMIETFDTKNLISVTLNKKWR